MKMHAVLFTNDSKAICGEYLHEFEREDGLLPIAVPAYGFKRHFNVYPNRSCKKCMKKILKWEGIKK